MCNSFESNALQNSNESVKRRLPKKFIDFYTSPNFHDSILLEYHVTKRQTKKNTFFDALTKWKRYDNGETFEIIFKNIIKYNANIDITDGYVEFEILLQVNLLCMIKSILNSIFKFTTRVR